MRAETYVIRFLDRCLASVHASRRLAVSFAVRALLRGGRLTLTCLGRRAGGATCAKHSIKRIDRLLGNTRLHGEVRLYFAALARLAIGGQRRPVILVDWTPVGRGSLQYALVASMPFVGRSVTIYAEVYPTKKNGNRAIERRFLWRLASVLPDGVRPIVVTDAGFRTPWFDAVSAKGWDFVGRVRHRTKVRAPNDTTWRPARQLWTRARTTPRDLGVFLLTQSKPRERRLVIIKKRKPRGRHRTAKTSRGKRSQSIQSQRARKSAAEPWLLATSLDSRADAIVGIYALRMQIEESFRDIKSHRFGWSLEDARSKTCERMLVMLLLAAIAAAVAMLAGAAAEERDLARQYQANTVRKRRVLSLFYLGKELLRDGNDVPFNRGLLGRLKPCFDSLST